MEQIQMILAWWNANGGIIAGVMLGILPVAEMVVRLTPTKKDDGAVQRVGYWVRWFFDKIKVPNLKEGDGQHPTLEEKEQGKA